MRIFAPGREVAAAPVPVRARVVEPPVAAPRVRRPRYRPQPAAWARPTPREEIVERYFGGIDPGPELPELPRVRHLELPLPYVHLLRRMERPGAWRRLAERRIAALDFEDPRVELERIGLEREIGRRMVAHEREAARLREEQAARGLMGAGWGIGELAALRRAQEEEIADMQREFLARQQALAAELAGRRELARIEAAPRWAEIGLERRRLRLAERLRRAARLRGVEEERLAGDLAAQILGVLAAPRMPHP